MNIRFDLLRELANHLKYGELGHEYFDFGIYNSTTLPECGTCGCAIGECPVLWPEQWKFNTLGDPVLIGFKDEEDSADSGLGFFNLSAGSYFHLFLPNKQNPARFGGQYLTISATKEKVADNILAFCEKMEKEVLV